MKKTFSACCLLGVMAVLEPLMSAPLPEVPGRKIVQLNEIAGIQAYSVLPTRKVVPQEVWPAEELDTATRRLYLAGAAGETEQLQLVLKPVSDGTAIPEFSPLRSAAGEIPANAFRMAQVSCVNITQISDWYGFRGFERGDVPDPVDWDESFALTSSRLNSLLLEVAIPAEAKAGTYRGKVAIRFADQRLDYPVEVEVWPFSLPPNTLSMAVFGADVAEKGPFEHYHGIVTHLKYGSSKFQVKVWRACRRLCH